MTSGYLKDMQYLKEVIFRKDYIIDDDIDFYDVEFFDLKNIID